MNALVGVEAKQKMRKGVQILDISWRGCEPAEVRTANLCEPHFRFAR